MKSTFWYRMAVHLTLAKMRRKSKYPLLQLSKKGGTFSERFWHLLVHDEITLAQCELSYSYCTGVLFIISETDEAASGKSARGADNV